MKRKRVYTQFLCDEDIHLFLMEDVQNNRTDISKEIRRILLAYYKDRLPNNEGL